MTGRSKANGVGAVHGSFIVMSLTCRCPGGRRLPLRLMPEAMFFLRAQLGSALLPADMVVQTYRCSDCGTVVEITAEDLALAEDFREDADQH